MNSEEAKLLDSEIKKEELAIEREKLRLSRQRFWIASVLIAIVALLGNLTIQYFTLIIERETAANEHLSKFKDEATHQNLDIRIALADFFKTVSANREARARWATYHGNMIENQKQIDNINSAIGQAETVIEQKNQEIANLNSQVQQLSDSAGAGEEEIRELLQKIDVLQEEVLDQRVEIEQKEEEIRRIDPLGTPSQQQISSVPPRWLEIARAELGTREIRGLTHNPRIIEYHNTLSIPPRNDESAWESSFVNWVLMKAGHSGPQSNNMNDWLTWGEPAVPVRRGCIAVLGSIDATSNRSVVNANYVGFFLEDRGDAILVFGGNQIHGTDTLPEVGEALFPKSEFLNCRYPLTTA